MGRSDRPAYAYLLVPPGDELSPVARRRLAAIKEFSDLGSGFRVAALDLEIRGAGNLLGAQQSGHIEAIGFDMYVTLLEQTVRELKGEPVEDDQRAAVNLGVDLRISEQYVTDTNQRLALYRRVAGARDEDTLATVLEETKDRYGPVPPSVLRLAEYGRIRILADQLGIESADRERHHLVLRFGDRARLAPDRLVAFVQTQPAVQLTPPAVLRVDLDALNRSAGAPPRRRPDAAPASWWTVPDGAARRGAGRPEPAGDLLRQVGALLDELRGPVANG